MLRQLRSVILALTFCALVGFASSKPCQGATILKLSLGDSGSGEIEFDGSTLHTIDDGSGSTLGQQDTGVLFLSFLDGYAPDIVSSPLGSVTLSGLVKSPPGANSALLINQSTIIQNFSGGTLSLWDQNNNLLLAGNLGASALTGAVGNPAGGLFQTSFGLITAGALMPYIDPASLLVSMNFSSIETIPGGQAGLTLLNPAPPGPFVNVDINPFRADATINVEGNQGAIPEPTAAGMLLVIAYGAFAYRRRMTL